MIELDCAVKNDNWGKLGSSSFVGQLLKSQHRPVNESTPYTALWMGTHESGPSKVTGLSPDFDSKPIDSVLKAWPEFIGNIDIATKYDFNLPILVKILSVDRPSPIQVNINANKDSKSCKIILALTQSPLLCGFRPHREIIDNLERFGVLRSLINPNSVSKYTESVNNNDNKLSKTNDYLVQCFKEAIDSCQTKQLINNFLESIEANLESDDTINLVKSLINKGLDPKGLVAFFFLNFINLNSDQAVAIDANQVHIFLKGNYLEVSHPNDRVIRTETDLDQIMSSASVEHKFPNLINSTSMDECSHLYSPKSSDWTIELIDVNQNNNLVWSDYQASPTSSGSFVLYLGPTQTVMNNVYRLKPGHIFFAPPGLLLRFAHLKGAFRLIRVSLKS